MKITNAECFIIENQLQNVVSELRDSKIKSLSLNVSVKRNLQKASELCADFRKEIQEFMPARLKEINELEKLNKKEEAEKESLMAEYNAEINKFLQNTIEFTVFNSGVNLESLSNIELTFDSASIIDFLFGEKDRKEGKAEELKAE
jgi:hypothetical protein